MKTMAESQKLGTQKCVNRIEMSECLNIWTSLNDCECLCVLLGTCFATFVILFKLKMHVLIMLVLCFPEQQHFKMKTISMFYGSISVNWCGLQRIPHQTTKIQQILDCRFIQHITQKQIGTFYFKIVVQCSLHYRVGLI